MLHRATQFNDKCLNHRGELIKQFKRPNNTVHNTNSTFNIVLVVKDEKELILLLLRKHNDKQLEEY